MRILCTLALALPFVATVLAPVQEGVELRWRGRPGDVLRVRLTMGQTVTNSMMAEPIESESVMVMRQEVMDVSPEGVGSLDVTFEAVRMRTGGPMAMEYDSTREGGEGNDPTLAAMFEPMLGADLHMKVEPSGRVVEVGGFEDLFDGLKAGSPELAEMVEKMFGGESLKRMLEVSVFPEEKLVAGDSWKREVALEAPMLGTMALVFENVFEGTEERGGAQCARIAVRGTIELRASDPASPLKTTLDDSSLAGTIYLALESGFLVESSMDTTMDFTMSMSSEAEGITMTMVSKQRMARIGKDDPLFE
jgi:hypothetical protein